ncbi:MAG: hypothetical protein KUG81_04580 [Gammaproteobacteria bacterium]|nr:hypothetical protein [Gammaproteobacteria bacterium]
MVINLNKTKVTKEGLLEKVTDVEIYRFYTGKNVVLGKNIISPLQAETSPSFGYFLGASGEMCFNDFRLGGGDCIKFVQKLFKLDYFEALSKIVVDFNLTNHFEHKKFSRTSRVLGTDKIMDRGEIIKAEVSKSLKVRRRAWKAHDIAYWAMFGITKRTLDLYQVFPIDYIFFGNSNPMAAEKYAYVFYEYKDGETTIKIYQPFSKNYKWLNSHNSSVWQGWSQLPKSGGVLVITKSLKDVMAITTVLKVASVSLQSESTSPKSAIMKQLFNRFSTLYVMYDNDFDKTVNTGRILGGKMAAEFNLVQLEVPDKYKSKDFSDLVKNHGNKEAKSFYQECIEVPF